MGRFKESQIIMFLELYKSFECLWKCNDRYYKVKSKRTEAYSRIRDAMGLSSILEVKQKIKSFRDTYTSERSKMKRSAASATHTGEVYRTKLRWYNLADSFLNSTDGRDRVDCIIVDKNISNRSRFLESPNGSDHVCVEYAGRTVRSQTFPTHRPMRIKNTHLQSENDTRKKISHGDAQQTDEFYHFGMNVAMQLRALPLVKSLDLQTKFQQMLCEVRIAYEQSQYDNENERCASSSASLECENPLSFHESIPFLSSPKEEKTVKTEYSMEEISNGMRSSDY